MYNGGQMKKILIFEKRKKAIELHKKGWSIRKIAKHLITGRSNINKWIQLNENLISTDNRGWKKGKITHSFRMSLRKYTQKTK